MLHHPQDAFAERHSVVHPLVGLVRLADLVELLAAPAAAPPTPDAVERHGEHDLHAGAPRGDSTANREADRFILALLGVARLGRIVVDRLAPPLPAPPPPEQEPATTTAGRWLR